MNVQIRYSTEHVDWNRVSGLLKSAGMAYYEPDVHKQAFEASFCRVFLYDEDVLIGFGRALSDGAYQAALYDCVVSEDYRGRGFGKRIVGEILSKLSHCNVILYASPGKEGFYAKLGFRKMSTGMAYFVDREAMAKRGFTT